MSTIQTTILKDNIRTIPDFPKPGILFRDVTTLMRSPEAFKLSIELLIEELAGLDVDFIAGIESRGFVFGAAMAQKMGVGFIPIRKKGKLPCEVHQVEYQLEYGTDILEIDKTINANGKNIVLVDDLLATGGTVLAAATLIEKVQGSLIKSVFVVDLPELGAKDKLDERNIEFSALISYEGH